MPVFTVGLFTDVGEKLRTAALFSYLAYGSFKAPHQSPRKSTQARKELRIMNFITREIRPGEAEIMKKLACPNFSVVEQLFMPTPKLGIVAQAESGEIAGGAFLVTAKAGDKKVGCIDIIFVLPAYRGSGVAKTLYHEAAAALRQHGCDTVMALVRGDNSQSLRRFEAEGIRPCSLDFLRKQIGLSATLALFGKTASLACATGCWVLCENAQAESIGGTGRNLLRTLLTNGLMLTFGALLGLLRGNETALWNMLAAISLLAVVTLGETIGRRKAKGHWQYVLPEGGLVPSAIVALLGGLYPMLGHWYLSERENTSEYRKRIAAPAKGAWLLLIIATFACGILSKMHPYFSCVSGLGVMLLLMYTLPFYPFDTFGGRRVREHDTRSYGALVTFSIITLACTLCGILLSIAAFLERKI
jgi:hypothetical protein